MKLVLGIIMCGVGLFFMILYLNILEMGYSFLDYVHFIFSRVECLIFLVGVLLIIMDIYKRRKKDAILS